MEIKYTENSFLHIKASESDSGSFVRLVIEATPYNQSNLAVDEESPDRS